jgi:AcrR family transcriptional regulator
MELVAQEAGYSVGALYTYFKGKQELYRSLYEAVSEEIDAALDRPMPASLDYRQQLELRLMRFFEVMDTKREVLVMYVAQRSSPDWNIGADLGELHMRQHEKAVERWAGYLEEGVAAGAVRLARPPQEVAPFVLAVASGAITNWARTNPTTPLTEYASSVTRFIFDGIGTGDRGPLPSMPDGPQDDAGERGEES